MATERVTTSRTGGKVRLSLLPTLVAVLGVLAIGCVPLPEPGNISTLAGALPGAGGRPATSTVCDAPGATAVAAARLYVGCRGAVVSVDLSTGAVRAVAGVGVTPLVAANNSPRGDGGPATAALVADVNSLAVAPNGDVYFCETYGNTGRLRRVAAATGTISSLTTAACKVAVSPTGDVYIGHDGVIDRIDPVTGQFLVRYAGDGNPGPANAGGPATQASLWGQPEMAFDAAGDLYLADVALVWKIDHASGIITVVAGTNVASCNTTVPAPDGAFCNFKAVAVRPDGKLLVADQRGWNPVASQIDLITPTPPSSVRYAGTGWGGYSGDGGPRLSAIFNGISGLAVDAEGNTYVSDTGNRRVRRIDTASGTVSTFLGNGTLVGPDGGLAFQTQMPGLTDVAVDPAGGWYLAVSGDLRWVSNASGGVKMVKAGLGIARIAVGPDGDVYFPTGDNFVKKVDPSTGAVTVVAGTGAPVNDLVVSFGNYNGDGIAATSANLYLPGALAFDAAGNLYIADVGNLRVRRVDHATGLISTVAGSGGTRLDPSEDGDGFAATNAHLGTPEAIAVTSAGDVYVSTSDPTSRIRKVDHSTGVITTVAGGGPAGYAGDGGPATSARLSVVTGLAVDAGGGLLVADRGNNRVRRIAPGGTITTVAGNGVPAIAGDGAAATSASILEPLSLSVGADGMVAIAANGRVRLYLPPS